MATSARAHGTRACYAAGCRRDECRVANTTYERRRSRQRLYGRPADLVDAAAVRKHVLELAAAGVGRREVARRAGVPQSTISKLRADRRRRVRPETAERLLSVHAETGLAGGALVDATGTWRRIQRLRELGWSKAAIARALGTGPALQLNHRRVTVRTRRKVALLLRAALLAEARSA